MEKEEKALTCPIGIAMEHINRKWVIQIIRDMFFGKKRFNEFKEGKPNLSNKVLSNCLKEMEEDELVVREQDKRHPNRVEYYLTDIGYTLQPVVTSMQKWGKEYKKYIKLKNKVQQ